MKNTTLCYIQQDGCYLMLHRTKKKGDENAGKWIGVGGKFEEGESPEECLVREVREETGLLLSSWRLRGIITFAYEGWPTEYMFLYTADEFTGHLTETCSEGELAWVPISRVCSLPLWEGDQIFLRLLAEDAPFFSLKLCYRDGCLLQAILNGRPAACTDDCSR